MGPEKRTVAVKHSRSLSKPLPQYTKDAFTRHFEQFCLELRILGHKHLAKHPNIVKLLGICVDDGLESPLMSLILDHSAYGSLDTFLQSCDPVIHDEGRMKLGLQAAKGLEALHQLKICHGDVKTQNTLVFRESDGWCVKLSDFGQSLIACHGDISGYYGVLTGTPLYSAPEIRGGIGLQDNIHSIEHAIMTDIFSFGLLLWEVLKHGQRFTKDIWNAGQTLDTEKEETILHALRLMTSGELLAWALKSTEKSVGDEEVCQRVSWALGWSLRDSPEQRKPMKIMSRVLDKESSFTDAQDISRLEVDMDDILLLDAWTDKHSLYDIFEAALDNAVLLDTVPLAIRKQAICELECLCKCEDLPDSARSHAALTLSECYTIGFGGSRDPKQIVYWLSRAAVLGNVKAKAWIYRVSGAIDHEMDQDSSLRCKQDIEKGLSNLPTECYLSTRIQNFNAELLMRAVKEFNLHGSDNLAQSLLTHPFSRSLFNQWTIDNMTAIHVASWVGDNATVSGLLERFTVDVASSNGFTPLHYACAGGHLSTLRLLLSKGASVSTTTTVGITPLHLCIYFQDSDLQLAVKELLQYGDSSIEQESEEIIWEDHDIILHGRPLDWAVLTRKKCFVETLLPFERGLTSLRIAISHFFWEIAEFIIQRNKHQETLQSQSQSYLDTIHRPFSHWIAHGSEHSAAIRRTVRVCRENGIPVITFDEDVPSLIDLIDRTRAGDDFTLLEEVISSAGSRDIKQTHGDGFSALMAAIQCSKSDEEWIRPLQMLAAHYSVEELESPAFFANTFLHLAVSHDSVVGAKLLLERGVNVNQPTHDEYRETPLHLCMRLSRSLHMYELLVHYGARHDLTDGIASLTPLEAQLLSVQRSPEFLNEVVKHTDLSVSPEEILHVMLHVAIAPSARGDAAAAFTHLLRSTELKKFLNCPGPHGATLLHVAAWHLHGRSVSVLLEAGADPGIPLEVKGSSVFPLQIACAVGRLAWMHDREDNIVNVISRRESAMGVATKLLQWHQANGGELFRGITALHLASHMSINTEIQRLRTFAAQSEPKGIWPGIQGNITPGELANAQLGPDFEALSILTDFFARLGFA